MEKKENTTLAFTTEIGTYGSMPIKDPTVQAVTELQDLAKDSKDKDLQEFLRSQGK